MYKLTNEPNIVLCLETGWTIPAGTRFWEEYQEWLKLGNTPEPAESITQADLIAQTKQLMTEWLDSVVQQKGYDNIVSCVSYANSTIDQFKEEALAAIAWRDAVYAKGYSILASIPEGVTTPAQVMELLPQPSEFGWE